MVVPNTQNSTLFPDLSAESWAAVNSTQLVVYAFSPEQTAVGPGVGLVVGVGLGQRQFGWVTQDGFLQKPPVQLKFDGH